MRPSGSRSRPPRATPSRRRRSRSTARSRTWTSPPPTCSWCPAARSTPTGSGWRRRRRSWSRRSTPPDRKSTRLNSSHMSISYAVFCLKILRRPRRPPLFPYTTLFRSEPIQATQGDTEPTQKVEVDGTFADVDVAATDVLVVPGGTVNADRIRMEEKAQELVKAFDAARSEEHTSELQSHVNLVCRLLLENPTTPTTTSTLSLHDALPI